MSAQAIPNSVADRILEPARAEFEAPASAFCRRRAQVLAESWPTPLRDFSAALCATA